MKETRRIHLRLLLIAATLLLALVITPPASAAPAQADRAAAPTAALAPTCTPTAYAPTKSASSGRVYFSGQLSCNYTTYVITLSVLKYRNGTYLGKVERKCFDCSYTYTSTYQYPDPAGNQSYCTVVHAFVSDAFGVIQKQYQARKCEVASF